VNAIGGRVASVPIGLAVAILLITVAIVPFLTPGWVAFEQGRAQAAAWTGYSTSELNAATGAILSDLVFGGDFDAMTVMKLKEVVERLEDAADAFEKVANTVETIALKES